MEMGHLTFIVCPWERNDTREKCRICMRGRPSHRAPFYGDATVPSRRPVPPCTLTRRGPGVCANSPHDAPQMGADRRYAMGRQPATRPGGAASLDPVGLPPGLSADGRRATPIRACILQAYPSRLCRAHSTPSGLKTQMHRPPKGVHLPGPEGHNRCASPHHQHKTRQTYM